MDVTIPCPCPPKADGTARHEQDVVTLRAVMDFSTAVLLQKQIAARIIADGTDASESGLTTFRLTTPDVMALITSFCVRNCIEAWTLVDEHGRGRPVTPENVAAHLETNLDAALAVAEAADDVYSEVVLPLVMRVLGRFVSTPTARPTSRETTGSPKPRKPSKRSSISTIPTVVTGPTIKSPDGVSNSLPSSGTAA